MMVANGLDEVLARVLTVSVWKRASGFVEW
jgi:hypothetical protein